MSPPPTTLPLGPLPADVPVCPDAIREAAHEVWPLACALFGLRQDPLELTIDPEEENERLGACDLSPHIGRWRIELMVAKHRDAEDLIDTLTHELCHVPDALIFESFTRFEGVMPGKDFGYLLASVRSALEFSVQQRMRSRPGQELREAARSAYLRALIRPAPEPD